MIQKNHTKTLVYMTLDTLQRKNWWLWKLFIYYINYLAFTSTDGNKRVLAKSRKLWDEIKHLIETINEGKKVIMRKISWTSNLTQMIITFK